MINSKNQRPASKPISRFKILLKASRAPFFTATIIPVVFGSLLAYYYMGIFIWNRFILAMIGAVLLHAGANLANDYFDHLWGADGTNPYPTPFSGGSRVIQEGLLTAKAVLYASLASFILGSSIGLYLNYICGGNIILIIGAIGIFFGFFYTAKPFRIVYASLGELAVGLAFGPLIVLGSYYTQAQQISLKIALASLPIGILIALVLFINEFPDYAADKAVGKRTLVVFLGRNKAIILYHILLVMVYLLIVLLVAIGVFPYYCLIALLSLPLAIRAVMHSSRNFEKIYELVPANALTVQIHSAIGFLLCAGVILAKFF